MSHISSTSPAGNAPATTTNLTDLADFAGRAEARGRDRETFWRAYRETARHRRSTRGRPVSDLLGVVMALAARTRRVVAPRAHVELDVFAPGGKRAVRLVMGEIERA